MEGSALCDGRDGAQESQRWQQQQQQRAKLADDGETEASGVVW